MSNKRQVLVAIALVLVAAIAATAYQVARPETDVPAAEGHDHAAMTATGQGNPVSLDAESARRIGVTYATAEMGALSRSVRTVGGVAFDETRLVSVNARIDGWIERLHVDFLGASVRRGQPLMAVYSPMLVSAQEELVLAARLLRESAPGIAADNARALLQAARERLAYWDIPPAEIARIERTGVTQRTLTLVAPASGVIVEKYAFQGARIMPGMELYRIADLSAVWIEGEVFERDLGAVKLGDPVRITFDGYPGEEFTGRMAYVYPTVSQSTRTGKVRIVLQNPGLRLKPGMYANVEFNVPVHLDGLHVPRTAVLTTGTRSLVFVRAEDGSLMPHEVTVGQAAGDHIEILAGLEVGAVVVASASFLVDAESNLGAAMKSMTAVEAAPAVDPHARH